MAQLPDLHVSDSSEAMLSGRKPPFRLLVRAVHTEGRRLAIRHAVSEGFVVSATTICGTCCCRRTHPPKSGTGV
jgi:hypothetical protein